ncbi:TRAP transporter small permease [Pseudogracilibacillus sp. SE30717A]|uniref:TRAP transporter small permease n=1 Tax=Pseudogracilibacillus sp. SE30717A TaxID=3098293 RepID=UPI00300DFC4E
MTCNFEEGFHQTSFGEASILYEERGVNMNALKSINDFLNKILLVTALTMLGAMVVIIIVQVFSRQIFNYTPSWSEEVSKLLFVWVAFLGIAYGFRERLHIALGLVIDRLSEKLQTVFDVFSKILILGLSIAMLYYGLRFTMLMGSSTMPGTGLPSSVLYAAIPVSGFFLFIYAINLFFEKGLHASLEDTEGH